MYRPAHHDMYVYYEWCRFAVIIMTYFPLSARERKWLVVMSQSRDSLEACRWSCPGNSVISPC